MSIFYDAHFFAMCRTLSRHVVVISDAQVAPLYGPKLCEECAKVGCEVILLTMPVGEGAKSWKTLHKLEEELLRRGIGRDVLLLGLGGGVVTDVVGFLASIYMRGVALGLVPTSLLGMIDAAIGGKTGLNTQYGKNQVGSLYPAQAIWIHHPFLDTLPETEWLNGRGELFKYGLIAQPSFLDSLVSHKGDTLIARAIQIKMEIVAQDPKEVLGQRRVLNFGHTVAHALETLSEYTLPHGRAVALGCLAESYVSGLLGYLPSREFEAILAAWYNAGFPREVPKNFSVERLIAQMHTDKKNRAGHVRCVLLDRVGHVVPFSGDYCRDIPMEEIEKMAVWFEQKLVHG